MMNLSVSLPLGSQGRQLLLQFCPKLNKPFHQLAFLKLIRASTFMPDRFTFAIVISNTKIV